MSGGDLDRAAGAALGALPPVEAARLEEELAKNALLATEVEEYRTVVETLETGIVREAPPAGLFDVVLSRIDGERAAAVHPVDAESALESEPTVAPARRRRFGRSKRLAPAFAAGFAVAAMIVAVVVALSSGNDLGSPDARAAVRGTPAFSAVHGDARLYATSRKDGVLVLDLADVPAPAPGTHYEVWVLRQSSGGAMESVGAFTPGGSKVRLELGLPGSGDYTAVDVSVEPDGGSASHSGQSLAGGRFEPLS